MNALNYWVDIRAIIIRKQNTLGNKLKVGNERVAVKATPGGQEDIT